VVNFIRPMCRVFLGRDNIASHDVQIISILDYMSQLEEAKQEELDQKNRKRIGFKTSGNQKDQLY
jgi:hypothetical protein